MAKNGRKLSVIESKSIQHFYIPEEQSIYLLSQQDAKRLKKWFGLCEKQLAVLGYSHVELIGQGAYGFVFSGISGAGQRRVFKFSRIDLAKHIQHRLEEEAEMLSCVDHPNVPKFVEYQSVRGQHILVMEHALGYNLEEISLRHGKLPARDILDIATQLHQILLALREYKRNGETSPIVHGDIKPSNVMWDDNTRHIGLIDWGSSVFTQLDEQGQFVFTNVMQLMSDDMQSSNARLGDIYFIGSEQLNGALTSPRFDEQGVASTLYALASGQSCRFARHIIRPCTLGLPIEFARTLEAMLSDDPNRQKAGGDYFMKHMPRMARIVCPLPQTLEDSSLAITVKSKAIIDTVVYSSRKSFLRQDNKIGSVSNINDAQFERYYKHYLQGMGETEKAFVAAVSRLGKYPIVGGLTFRWKDRELAIDSDLTLFDQALFAPFSEAVNTVVTLARAITSEGMFKTCMFDARRTIHVSRARADEPFILPSDTAIPFDISQLMADEAVGNTHSYFEDGDDPDEQLKLPQEIVNTVAKLNTIQHSGCIIFEVLENNLKIHNYFSLVDEQQQDAFSQLLKQLLEQVSNIRGVGISGYMKLPFKATRIFQQQTELEDFFYPFEHLTND